MAGGGGESSNDNPLPLNVVPLIDVIFCLLLFFMCSFHFKSLEGKFEAWLPADKGIRGVPPPIQNPEFRVTLAYDATLEKTTRRFGRTDYTNDDELGAVLRQQFDYYRNGAKEPSLVIESRPNVPWDDVVRVLDIARAREIPRVEFSLASSAAVLPEPVR